MMRDAAMCHKTGEWTGNRLQMKPLKCGCLRLCWVSKTRCHWGRQQPALLAVPGVIWLTKTDSNRLSAVTLCFSAGYKSCLGILHPPEPDLRSFSGASPLLALLLPRILSISRFLVVNVQGVWSSCTTCAACCFLQKALLLLLFLSFYPFFFNLHCKSGSTQ